MRASRLGKRFAVLVIGVSSVLTLVLTACQLFYDYRQETGDCQEQLLRIGAMSAASLAESLWQVNKQQVELQLSGIMRLPNVSFAAVHDQDGKIIASFGKLPSGGIQERKILLSYGATASKELVGDLQVIASDAPILRHLARRVAIALVSNLVKDLPRRLFYPISRPRRYYQAHRRLGGCR